MYDHRLLYYPAAYLENKYVDRSGTLYPKPKFSTAIGNNTIIPLVSITLDAFYDSLYNIPVFYDVYEDKVFKKPLAGKEPTVAKFEDYINHSSDIRRYVIDKKI